MSAKVVMYSAIMSALSVVAFVSVVPASLAFVSNPKPPKELLRK